MKRFVLAIYIVCLLFSGCSKRSSTIHPTVLEMMQWMELGNSRVTSLYNYSSCEIEASEIVVTQAEIDSSIDLLLQEYETKSPIMRSEIRLGDLVNYTTYTTWQDTVIGDPKTSHMKIGNGSFDLEIENSLVGAQVGKEYLFDGELPEDESLYGNLAGEKVKFHITVDSIYEVKTPALCDAWVQEQYGCKTTEEFYEQVRNQLLSEKQSEQVTTAQRQLMKQIMDKSKFAVDEEQAVAYGKQLALSGLSAVFGYGYSVETYQDYLTDHYGSDDAYYSQCYEGALNDIRYFLTIGAIAAEEGFSVSEEEFTERCTTTGMDIETISDENACYIRYYVLESEVLEFLYQASLVER